MAHMGTGGSLYDLIMGITFVAFVTVCGVVIYFGLIPERLTVYVN